MPLTDAAILFVEAINNLKTGEINLHSPLKELVIKTCGKKLAYIDNRKGAKQVYGFDFWSNLSEDWLRSKGIQKTLLYSKSDHFPDFLFKINKKGKKIIGGSLVELKDSKSGSIASFNSTIPTKHKSLEEIDVVNGDRLVSRIATIMDGKLAVAESYFKFERKCLLIL